MINIVEFFNGEIPEQIKVRATAGASSNRLKLDSEEDGSILIRAYVTTVAEHGKANSAIIKLLAKEFRLPIKCFKIIHGATSKDKVISVSRIFLRP